MATLRVKNFEEARNFIKKAGFCLRYWANDSLPIASMYEAVLGNQKDPSKADLKVAIEITNKLLEKHEVVEVNVIADRVCLVHRSIVPSLYKLVRSKSESGAIPKVSPKGLDVLALLREKGEIFTNDVRKLLGVPSSKTSEDPAYEVLSELQRHLLIDRGPFKVSNQTIPYLAKEGYPYHLFEEAHLELAKLAEEMTPEQARKTWLLAFLKSSQECSVRKMASIFKTFLQKDEIESELSALAEKKKIKFEKIKGTVNVAILYA